MKIIDSKTTDQVVSFEVEIDEKTWTTAVKKAKEGIAKTLKIEGFRPGKAPLEVAEKHMDMSKVYSRALNTLIQPTIEELEKSSEFTSKNENIVETCNVDIKEIDDKKLILNLSYDIFPIVTLGDYKNIDLPKFEEAVSDEEVEKDLMGLARMNKIIKEKTGKKADTLEKGDIAVFDFTGYKDGEPFSGGSAKNYELEIGSNQFIPGFEDQMVGMKIGEERDLKLKFPEDYQSKDLAGKDTVFKVTLHGIKTVEMPKIDDELVKKQNLKGIETVQQFKDYTKKQLLMAKEQDYKERVTSQIINGIIAITNVSHIPQSMINSETQTMYKAYEDQLSQKGLTVDQYLQLVNKTKEEFDEQVKEEAKRGIILSLGMEEIAKKEHIEITEDDIMDYITKITKIYGGDPKEIREKVGDNTGKIESDLLQAKVFDVIAGLGDNKREKPAKKEADKKETSKKEEHKQESKKEEHKAEVKKEGAKPEAHKPANNKKPAPKKPAAKK